MDGRFSTPVFDVVLDVGNGEISEHRVQIWNADIVQYDRTAAKHGWGRADSVPFLWNTFVVWAAMRRTGAIAADLAFDTFEKTAIQVKPIPPADLEKNGTADGIDPTLRVVEPV